MKKYEIKNTYSVAHTHEFDVDCNGWEFLIIYGEHVNGWFIAIPNWNVSVEAANPTDTFYNAEKLAACGQIDVAELALELAEAIKEHWKSIEG
ncbi:MAG: hypothetical protein NC313_17375 [Butyrivibrio sp.]|nr:hypothetical protein [Butyrivibrio sp.]